MIIFAPEITTQTAYQMGKVKWKGKVREKNFNNEIKKEEKMPKPRNIIVEYGAKEKIAKDCGCSTKSVMYALRGATESELANLIRKRAIEIYGGVYQK